MPRKNIITIRLTDAGLAQVDEIATAEDRTRSDTCRILIAEAVAARVKRAARR